MNKRVLIGVPDSPTLFEPDDQAPSGGRAMLSFDQNNDSVRNDFAAGGIDASLVVGRAHRTSPGRGPSGKRLSTAHLATPVVDYPREGVVPVSEPPAQERWCRRQRQGMSCCMTASGQAPAAIWASLIINQQATL